MARSSNVSLLAVLVLASSASATTVGPLKGMPVTGRPLEVNIPFAVDGPTDRACASANVRYGNVPVPRMTLHVQGQGLKRNLLVTSRSNVSEPKVTVDVRVGCGPKAVARRFIVLANMPVAKSPPAGGREPLFPPPAPEATPQEGDAPKADASAAEELRKAQTQAASAIAQLQATRNELAALLDVERRTAQTLIAAEHQVRNAKAEAARMHLILNCVGAALGLAAAGLAWLEFQRVVSSRRAARAQPAQEPTILSGMEMPA